MFSPRKISPPFTFLFAILWISYSTAASLTTTPHKTHSTLPQHQLTQTLYSFRYQQLPDGQLRTTQSLVSYDTDQLLPNAGVIKHSITTDEFTGNSLRQTDAYGHSILLTYDSLKRNTTINYGTSDNGNPIITRTRYQLDAGDTDVIITHPNGYQQRLRYNAQAQLIDSFDNLLSDDQLATTSQHRVQHNGYDDLGNLSLSQSILDRVTRTQFDAKQRPIDQQTLSVDGQISLKHTRLYYNDVQHTLLRYALSGTQQSVTTTQYYDDQNHTIRRLTLDSHGATNRKSQQQFDAFGQPIASQSQHSHGQYHYLSTSSYNALGENQQNKLFSDTPNSQAEQMTITREFGLLGNTLQKTLHTQKSDTQRYRLTYSAKQQLLQRTIGIDGSVNALQENYTYNNNGELIRFVNYAKQALSYSYAHVLGHSVNTLMIIDATTGYSIHKRYNSFTGKLIQAYYSDKQHKKYDEIDWHYTPDGLLQSKTYIADDGSKKTLTNHYDRQTRLLTSRWDIANNRSDYQYDKAGQVIHISLHKANSPISAEVEYVYANDDFDRLHIIKHWLNHTCNALQPQLISSSLLHYDAYGNIDSITRSQGFDANGQAIIDKSTFVHGADGNLTRRTKNYVELADQEVHAYQETYTYDNNNRLIQTDHVDFSNDVANIHQTTQYIYDDNSNLKKTLRSSSPSFSAKNSNPIITSFVHNGLDQLTNIQGKKVSYDDNGNLTHGANGDRWDYNALNQLTTYHPYGKKIASHFVYQPDGSRRAIAYTDSKGCTHQVNEYTLGGQLINETDENNNTSSYLLNGATAEARIVTINYHSSVTFYDQDPHDNITNRVKINLKSEQRIHSHIEYDAYGNVRSDSKKTAASPLAYEGISYNGRYHDRPEMGGLYYLHARYYQASIAAFMQRDSITFLNQHAYVMGNPNAYGDPSGHMPRAVPPSKRFKNFLGDVIKGAEDITETTGDPIEFLFAMNQISDLLEKFSFTSPEEASAPPGLGLFINTTNPNTSETANLRLLTNTTETNSNLESFTSASEPFSRDASTRPKIRRKQTGFFTFSTDHISASKEGRMMPGVRIADSPLRLEDLFDTTAPKEFEKTPNTFGCLRELATPMANNATAMVEKAPMTWGEINLIDLTS